MEQRDGVPGEWQQAGLAEIKGLSGYETKWQWSGSKDTGKKVETNQQLAW
jgi:hypothetical protein